LLLLAPALTFAQQKYVLVLSESASAQVSTLLSGFSESLKAGGFVEGKNLKITQKIRSEFKGDTNDFMTSALRPRPDLIFVVSTNLAQLIVKEALTVPVVFADVPDPVSAGLLESMEAGSPHVTGVASALAVARQVELIRQIAPNAKRVGVLYNPKNPGSSRSVKQLMDGMAKFGIVLIEASLARSKEVGSAARSLASKVDVFLSLDDATVNEAYLALVKVAIDSKVPLIASQPEGVKMGALAGFVLSYKDLGAQAGRISLKILRGAKLGSVAPEFVQKPALWLNGATAKKQGIQFSEALLKSATQVLND
jgi:putative ABC transport system substrate-binding protein